MNLHKCKVYKCKIRNSTSKKYDICEYYKIYIRCNKKLNYFHIHTFNERDNTKLPFSLFFKNILAYSYFYPPPIYINNCNKTECELTFHKYIEIYPNITQLFENKDEYSIRLGLEILKQQLEINVQ